jgi:hypothetical protein
MDQPVVFSVQQLTARAEHDGQVGFERDAFAEVDGPGLQVHSTSNLPNGVNAHIVTLRSTKGAECCYVQDFA